MVTTIMICQRRYATPWIFNMHPWFFYRSLKHRTTTRTTSRMLINTKTTSLVASRVASVGVLARRQQCAQQKQQQRAFLRVSQRWNSSRSNHSSNSTTAQNVNSKTTPQFGNVELIVLSVMGGLVMTTLGGIKYFHDYLGSTEGLWRSVSFYSFAIPKYLEYRYHMWKQSPDEEWDRLNLEASRGALRKILELEGTIMCMSH